MKKAVSASLGLFLALSPLVFSSVPALAEGTATTMTTATTATTATATNATTPTTPITYLQFSAIEQDITANNPTVLANQHLVDSTDYGYAVLNSNVNDMQNALNSLGTAITAFQTSENNLNSNLASYTAMPPNTPYLSNLTNANDNKLLAGLASNTGYLAGIYQANIQSLQANQTSLLKQLYQLESRQASLAGTLAQVNLQTTMVDKQLVWAAQSLYAGYNKIAAQQQDLNNTLGFLQEQLAAVKVQVSLGMATADAVAAVQSKISDVRFALDNLGTQATSVKGDLNMLLGQDYDTPLSVQAMPGPDTTGLESVNFDNDIDTALAASYSIQIETKIRDTKQNVANLDSTNYGNGSYEYLQAKADLDGEQVKLDDETRKFSNAFHKAYEDVRMKEEALTYEKTKRQTQWTQLNETTVKYNLGMVSELEFAAAQSAYQSELSKVQNLQNDLEMSYTKYQWMKNGLSLQ